MDIRGKRALVTGGSSGIGLEIAAGLLREGASVVVVGRRADAVDDAARRLSASGPVHAIAADVTAPNGQQRLIDDAVDRLSGLDLLVNNAGGVSAGYLETVDEGDVRAMVEVNLTAPILLTRAALPVLREGGEAMIVNVSSGIAQVALPFYATYAAVKAGIAHFGEALRRELAGSGVGVLTVYPTATETPMMATSAMARQSGRERAEDVAAEVIAAIRDDRRDVVRGDAARMEMIALNRSDPRQVDRRLGEMRAAMGVAVRNHRAL